MHVDGEKEDKHAKEVQQESTMISGPQVSAQTCTKVNPWLGRLRSPSASPNASVESTGRNVNSKKGKNKMDQPVAVFYVSIGHSMIDYDSSSGENLDEEFGIPKLQPPRVCRSMLVKYPVDRLKYDSYVHIILCTWQMLCKRKNPLVSMRLLELNIGMNPWMRR